MGQPITVTVRPGVRSDVRHFELNRSLTGMQTHRYQAGQAIPDMKPPDELARRLFALGGVSAVTIYSSVVTVVAPAEEWSSLQAQVEDTITNLFIHYREDEPPAAVPVEPAPPTEATEPAGEATAPAEITG